MYWGASEPSTASLIFDLIDITAFALVLTLVWPLRALTTVLALSLRGALFNAIV